MMELGRRVDLTAVRRRGYSAVVYAMLEPHQEIVVAGYVDVHACVCVCGCVALRLGRLLLPSPQY